MIDISDAQQSYCREYNQRNKPSPDWCEQFQGSQSITVKPEFRILNYAVSSRESCAVASRGT